MVTAIVPGSQPCPVASCCRAYVYAQLFNRLLRQRAAGQHLTPFEFYMDLNSGTRNNVELFRRLRVPILSFSRNPHDRYTVPLPDFHLTLGVYNDSLDYTDAGFGHLQGFANGRAGLRLANESRASIHLPTSYPPSRYALYTGILHRCHWFLF